MYEPIPNYTFEVFYPGLVVEGGVVSWNVGNCDATSCTF
jgi:hypothetical protein